MKVINFKNPDVFAISASLLLSIIFLAFWLFFNSLLIENQLYKDLEDKDWRIRLKSAIVLSEKKGDRRIRSLVPLLKDKSPYIRKVTSQLLSEIGKPVIPHLLNTMKNQNGLIRENSAVILANIKDPNSYKVLIELLNDKRPNVLKRTIHALGEHRNPNSRKYFLRFLKHPDTEIMRESSEALKKLNDTETIKILIDLVKSEKSDLKYEIANILKTIGEPVIPYALSMLSDKKSENKTLSIEILSGTNNEKSLKALIKALDDFDDSVRRSAAYVLSEMGREEVVPYLIKSLHDPDEYKRQTATEALWNVNNPQSFYPLIERLNDSNDDVRYFAYLALARLKNTSAVPYLIEALKSDNQVMKTTIMQVLAYLKDQRAGESILKILNNDKDWTASGRTFNWETDTSVGVLREYAVRALGDLGYVPSTVQLINALKDEDFNIQTTAKFALVKIGLPASKYLIRALNDKNNIFKTDVIWILGEIKDKKAVMKLTELLKDENENIRMAAAEALGKIKDKNAVTPLLNTLGNKDYDVIRRVIHSLGVIGDKRAVKPLLKLINKKYYLCESVEALGSIGDGCAVNALVGLLKKGECIDHSVAALLRIGNSGIDVLKKMLTDKQLGDYIRFSIADAFGSSSRQDLLEVLDELLESKDLTVIAGAYKYFIRKGAKGSEKLLIDALDYYRKAINPDSHIPIYENYATSGNLRLEAAAYISVNDPTGTSLRFDGDLCKPIWGSANGFIPYVFFRNDDSFTD